MRRRERNIGTEGGVIKARDFKRRSDGDQRWSWEELEKVKGSPWEPIPGREGIELKTSVNIDTGEAVHDPMIGFEKPYVKRRFRINKEDVLRRGMTPGCKGCSALNRGGQPVNHSEECRSRFQKELEEEGDERIEKDRVKREDALTEAIEKEEER